MTGPVHLVVPVGIADPARPSGGNVYDRRVVRRLRELGRLVVEHPVADDAGLRRVLAGLPDGAVVVVDGLVGSAADDVLVLESDRLRVVVLLHMPLAEATADEAAGESERRVLGAAAAVLTTSRWARDWVVAHHRVPPGRVHVAEPGVDAAPPATGSRSGGNLTCLSAVTPAKGHDVLVAALARVADLDWRCTCAGSVEIDPAFVARLKADARRAGISDRVTFPGPLVGEPLRAALAATDLLVSASRRESYGMAVTEALARSVPVVVTDVGGHPEAVGLADDGPRPGVLVPPDDPARLAASLRSLLTDPGVRERLRRSAARRAATLPSWSDTTARVDAVVDAVRVNRPGDPLVLPHRTPATG